MGAFLFRFKPLDLIHNGTTFQHLAETSLRRRPWIRQLTSKGVLLCSIQIMHARLNFPCLRSECVAKVYQYIIHVVYNLWHSLMDNSTPISL